MIQTAAPSGRPELDGDIRELHDIILFMGEAVGHAVTGAVGGLIDGNPARCTGVIRADAHINALQRRVREVAFTALLRQAPVAGDLRAVLGCMHMAAELERMGDHCVSIARIGRTLADIASVESFDGIQRLADLCGEQLRDILGALVARDVDEARGIAVQDDRIDAVHHRLVDELFVVMAQEPERGYVVAHLISAAHHLERIGDRVTNLAEDLVFLETGENEELG